MSAGHLRKYLEYVRNTGGNATRAHFVDDWEPIGNMVWDELIVAGYVTLRDNKVVLTEKGEKALRA